MPPTYTERRARTHTCGALRVSSKHSRPARTTSGSSTEALGSGKRENLSATSSSLKRRLASSFGHSLEANTHTLRRPGASPEVAAPPRSQHLPLSSGPGSPPQPSAPLLRAAASPAPGPGRGGPLPPLRLRLPLRGRHFVCPPESGLFPCLLPALTH